MSKKSGLSHTFMPLYLRWILPILVVLSILFGIFVPGMNAEAHPENLQLNDADRLWVMISAALVFTMQAGFLCLETGLTRNKHVISVALKNVADWCIASLCFYLLGFGLMYGESIHGLLGSNLFAFTDLNLPNTLPLGIVFFLFQLAYAGTATTIVSGAMAERTAFIPYLIATAVVSALIFPIYGHWVWGDVFLNHNHAWLKQIGYVDFAGASVVHIIGGTVSLMGIWLVGPRLGRFDRKGHLRKFEPSNIALAGAGVLVLWLGWWGFNGGSLFQFKSSEVASIILNTNMAGAAGALSAYLHGAFFQKQRDLMEKLIGGTLGGLVAVTALANIVSPLGAIATGILAGILHNLAFVFLSHKLKLDDPVGAVPVHAVCGSLGILCVPLFGKAELLPAGSRLAQLGVQVLGLGVCLLWTCLTAGLMFFVLKKYIGLRVSPLEEMQGVSLARLLPEETPLTEAELDSLLEAEHS